MRTTDLDDSLLPWVRCLAEVLPQLMPQWSPFQSCAHGPLVERVWVRGVYRRTIRFAKPPYTQPARPPLSMSTKQKL